MAVAHRLFVAVDLSRSARDAVENAAQVVWEALAREGSARRVRRVDARQWHLTLAFMAAVPDEQLDAVTGAVAPPLPVAPFTMELTGLGMFPAAGSPRVLWVGVGAGRDALETLAAEVRRRLQSVGIVMEDRSFTAHLTLGRWRESRRADREIVTAAAPHGVIGRSRVDHVTLYESVLLADGPRHTAVVRSPLGGVPGSEGSSL